MRHDGQDPRSGAARHARLKGAIAVPLGMGDECSGVLELFAHDERDNDAETSTMLATVGAQLARSLAHERAVALYDPLTGLATTALLIEHIALALARARRSGASVMVLHLRLDAGQDLLATLAGRVIDVLRNTDVLARTGPSELGVLLADLRYGPDEVFERVGSRVAEALEEPLLLAGEEFRVQPTIGYATFPGGAETAAELLAEAAQSARAGRRGPAPSGGWDTASSSVPEPGSSALTPLRSTKPST
jgi:GGDEF domain-containing protein